VTERKDFNPFKRIAVYTSPDPDPDNPGGITIDVVGMIEDLIAVAKLDGRSLEDLLGAIRHEWPRVSVEVQIPRNVKN